MKAQELRIGNFCAWGYLDKTIYPERLGTIWNITNKSVLVKTKTHKHTVGIDRVMPIPLTEEWLLKFGLIKVKNIDEDSIWMFNDINFTYETERCLVILDRYIISVCKYVHQLQNLYFALTGEELTINEKSPTI